MNRFQRAASQRRRANVPSPKGFDEAAYEGRAKIACEQMRKVDLMPPEYRALVHEYGYKVRALMCEGRTVNQIKRELTA